MGVMLVLIPLVHAAAVHRGPQSAAAVARMRRIASPIPAGLAGETLNAMQTIQAFTLEDLQSRRYGEAVEAELSSPRSAAIACARC